MSTRLQLVEAYREHKTRDPDLILLFREGAFYAALADDARVILDITRDHQLAVWRTEDNRFARFGVARLDDVLSLVVAAGRRAAVLEQVKPVAGRRD